jgi:hypothetical protein
MTIYSLVVNSHGDLGCSGQVFSAINQADVLFSSTDNGSNQPCLEGTMYICYGSNQPCLE